MEEVWITFTSNIGIFLSSKRGGVDLGNPHLQVTSHLLANKHEKKNG